MQSIKVTEKEFQELDTRALQYLKETYGTKGSNYTSPIREDGNIYFFVEDRILLCLTDQERERIIDCNPKITEE